MTERRLDRESILDLLGEVATRLGEDDPRSVVVLVGGSFMALQGLRASTADVDSATRIGTTLRSAIASVAAERDLRPDWLNDRAAGFAPAGLAEDDCEVLFEHPRLVALGPPADYVFIMKLQAARAIDYDDMVALWPRCSFATAQSAVGAFETAYPHEEPDPHLSEFVTRIANAAAP